MTTHVDEGVLMALADGELPASDRGRVERHLAGCMECRDELASLRIAAREFAGAISLLDRPAPRPAAPPAPPAPLVRRSGPWPAPARSLARAAVLVLGFVAAASATVPGSPVREWLRQAWAPGREAVAVAERPAGEAAPPVPALETPPEAGVSVAPSRGEIRVMLTAPAPELRVRARITEGERAGVFATGPAADARFTTGPGRIEVAGAGPGELRIELPRGARSATVLVDGKPYLVKDGDQLRLSVAGEDGAAEVSFQVRP